MVEIKFRAWDKKKEMMGDVMSLTRPEQAIYILVRFWANARTEARLRDTLIIMQFTGLSDKNGKGKEVYADDVVSSYNGVTCHVYWDSEYGQWWGRMLNKTQGEYTRPLCQILDNTYVHIIGNIHENPELVQ